MQGRLLLNQRGAKAHQSTWRLPRSLRCSAFPWRRFTGSLRRSVDAGPQARAAQFASLVSAYSAGCRTAREAPDARDGSAIRCSRPPSPRQRSRTPMRRRPCADLCADRGLHRSQTRWRAPGGQGEDSARVRAGGQARPGSKHASLAKLGASNPASQPPSAQNFSTVPSTRHIASGEQPMSSREPTGAPVVPWVARAKGGDVSRSTWGGPGRLPDDSILTEG